MQSKLKVGDRVTCKFPRPAFYSNYGLNRGRHIVFSPGMAGEVVSISPKVCTPPANAKLPPWMDRKPNKVVVDYMDEDNKKQRVNLNFINIERA